MKRLLAVLALFALVGCAGPMTQTQSGQTIVDEWASVKAPPAPVLKPVKSAPKETALLVLDLLKQNCGQRPRCVASVPKVQRLLTEAREKGVLVVHAIFDPRTAADILPGVAARPGEPIVSSGPNKFLNTALEKILKERGVKTVIVVGTAAEGAVLNTASEAALRGFRVIAPVDGASSANLYAEQYTAWHLANSPRVGPQVTLTRSDLVGF